MINWKQVNELRQEVGEEDFEEVVELFLEEVQEVVDDLRADTTEASTLESKMHFLKGSALNLGFEEFSSLCAQGEKNAALGAVERSEIDAVISSYEASKAVFVQQIALQVG